jgi:transcriptional regulator with XRE-family HTH domain
MNGQAIKAILGKNIKLLRKHKGLTQAVLAEKTGISVIFLSSIERGTKFPKPDTLGKIAQVLSIEVFELFKGSLVPSDSKKLVTALSKDIKKKLNAALEDIFEQYLG